MRALRRLRRTAVPTVGGLLVMASVAGWGRPAGLPVGDVQQPDAARAVRQLTAWPTATPGTTSGTAGTALAAYAHAAPTGSPSLPTSALTTVPSDFARVMGYEPVLSGGRLVRPDGSCSSPFGPTDYGFGDSCRAHDLGYDLLRYAERKGQPLGGWARQAVDHEFDRSLHGRCSADRATATCAAAASVYADAVRLNSVRQGFGVPVAEGPARTLLGLGVGLVVAVLLAGGKGPLPRPGISAPRLPATGRRVVVGASR